MKTQFASKLAVARMAIIKNQIELKTKAEVVLDKKENHLWQRVIKNCIIKADAPKNIFLLMNLMHVHCSEMSSICFDSVCNKC